MREPRQYGRSMAICQTIVTVLYLAIGIVVYYYCGSYVASPALGSAGTLFKRICYGLALPGLLASMILLSHVFHSNVLFLAPLTDTRSQRSTYLYVYSRALDISAAIRLLTGSSGSPARWQSRLYLTSWPKLSQYLASWCLLPALLLEHFFAFSQWASCGSTTTGVDPTAA